MGETLNEEQLREEGSKYICIRKPITNYFIWKTKQDP